MHLTHLHIIPPFAIYGKKNKLCIIIWEDWTIAGYRGEAETLTKNAYSSLEDYNAYSRIVHYITACFNITILLMHKCM